MATRQNQLRISMIICAYTDKRWQQLLDAVQSIQMQSVAPAEIILAIDHNPELAERARKNIVGATIIENTEDQGLSGARNSAIRQAKGDIIAFMDEDAVAEPDWLEHLINAYQDREVVGVGGAIIPLWEGERPRWFPEEFDWVVGCTYRGMPQTQAPVRNLIGCNMSFRQEVFEAVGGFRNGIGRVGTRPVGCEETELCIRLHQHWPRKVLLYDPTAVVKHHVPINRATWSYFRSRCYSEGLSKALVAHFVGAGAGLASERSYTFQTLPQGMWKSLSVAIHGRWSALGRVVAIPLGLTLTVWGYLLGKIRLRHTVSITAGHNQPNSLGL